MQPGRIRGLLFDKDGTLFDFTATWAVVTGRIIDALAPDAASHAPMARAIGFDPVSREFLPGAPMVAGTVQDCAALWRPFRPDLDAGQIIDLAERIAAEAVAGGALVPVHPDLKARLGELRRQGYRLGVATNDSEASARQQLATAGILDEFDFVAGFDSGHGAKPGSGMLTAFARATGLAPLEVAMVGDSLHDMTMAREAGLRIGVLTGPADAAELEGVADIVLDSIAALPEFLAGAGGSGRILRKHGTG